MHLQMRNFHLNHRNLILTSHQLKPCFRFHRHSWAGLETRSWNHWSRQMMSYHSSHLRTGRDSHCQSWKTQRCCWTEIKSKFARISGNNLRLGSGSGLIRRETDCHRFWVWTWTASRRRAIWGLDSFGARHHGTRRATCLPIWRISSGWKILNLNFCRI